MRRIQYSVFRRDTENASGKAKWDASDILLSMGFKELYCPSRYRPIRVAQQLTHTLALKNDVLLAVQYPANKPIFYRILSRKHTKSFALIHDLESLRFQTDIAEDARLLNTFDGVISHNPAMTRAIRDGGYNGAIVNLGLFDYLDFSGDVSPDRDPSVVAFAGNLIKAGFVRELQDTGLRVNLYGGPTPPPEILCNGVRYMGSFPSNDVPGIIAGGWGLVWDGDSVDTCSGLTGNYLRYNCPHKASMYIIAERPLLVWSESAIAPYVMEHNLGITINSLTEIADSVQTISERQYYEMLQSVRREKEALITGSHMKTAINTLLPMIDQ